MAAPTRVYIVGPKVKADGAPDTRRLVRATHPSHALRHVADDELFVTVASQDDLIELLAAGAAVEALKPEQTEIPTT
jgi:hypothetical protein